MAQGFPIYSDLIIKMDSNSLNQVQAQLRQSFSAGSLHIDVLKTANADQFKQALSRVRMEARGLSGDMQEMGERVTKVFARFSAYLIASGGILASIGLLKDAVGQALKFNSELIRIRQVSGDSESSIRALGAEVTRLSTSLGVSSNELIKSAVTLRQAGLSVKDTTVALEALAQADLAPNFDSMAKTTEGLIAIYQQFGKNIGNVKGQLGGLNAVAGEYAAEASDLITMVQKTGGAAKVAGANLGELTGIFTAVRATTRESADSIATGLRTIFGRLQRPDTVKFLDELGIHMRMTAEEAKEAGKNVGDFVGPFEAMIRLNTATANMGSGSTMFSNIIEEVGGLRQVSRVVPFIKEAATAQEAYNVYLAGQNSLYVNSLQKQDDYLTKLTKIKEELLAVGRAFVNSDGFKEFASILGSIARAATSTVNAIAPLMPYLLTLATINIGAGIITSIAKPIGAMTGLRNFDTTPIRGMASGGIVPGQGNTDSYPAVLMPGEAVIPKKSVAKFPSLIQGLIKGNVPGMSFGGIVGGGGDATGSMWNAIVEKALVDVAIKTKVNPEEIIKKIKLVDELTSKTHSGKQAAGLMSKSGIMTLNTSQIAKIGYDRLVALIGHEVGHKRTRDLGLLSEKLPASTTQPAHTQYLKDPAVQARAEAFARKTGQSFELQKSGYRYAMSPSEMSANLFAMGDKNVVRATDAERARAAEYVKSKAGLDINTGKPFPVDRGGDIYNRMVAEHFAKTRGPQLAATMPQSSAFVNSNAALAHHSMINMGMRNIPVQTIDATSVKPNVYPVPSSPYTSAMSQYGMGAVNDANRWGGLGGSYSSNNPNIPGNTNYAGSRVVPWQSINQGFVPFTGGGRGGQALPPNVGMGAFGYGRGGLGGGGTGGTGAGGTGAGGAGAGGGASAGMHPADQISKIMSARRIFGGLSSAAAIGIPLGLAGHGAYNAGDDDRAKYTTAAMGAGLGAQLGSIAGPFGALAGSLVGGIVGWIKGSTDAVKEVKEKKLKTSLDKSLTELSTALEDMNEGRGSIGSVAKSIRRVKEASTAIAMDKAGGKSNFLDVQNEEFQKNAGLTLASQMKIVNDEIKRQVKSGRGMDITSGDTGEILDNIVQLRQRPGERFTQKDAEKEFKKTYDIARAEKMRADADVRFITEINKSVASATAFAEAVKAAGESASDMDKQLRTIVSGGYAGASLGVGDYGHINQGTLGSLGKFGGGMFSDITSKVGGVDEISKFLPDVLSRVIKPGEEGGANNSISDSFAKAFEQIGKDSGKVFDKKILSVMADKLQSMKSEELFEEFKKAPEQFADNMVKSFEPARKALESIGKYFEERDKVYQQGLEQIRQFNHKINELNSQRVGIRTSLADIGSEIEARKSGLNPNRFSRLANAAQPFAAEQERLTGNNGVGLSARGIASLIRDEKNNNDALKIKATAEANAGGNSTKFRDELGESTRRLDNLNAALSNLTKRTEELSRLHADITREEESSNSKLEFKTSLLTASFEDLIKMNQSSMDAKLLLTFGADKIRKASINQGVGVFGNNVNGVAAGINFSAERIKSGLDWLARLPKNQVVGKIKNDKGQLVDETAGEARERIVRESGIGGEALNTEKERAAILSALTKIQEITTSNDTAVDAMAEFIQIDREKFYAGLTENNNKFFQTINGYVAALQTNAIKSEIATKQTKLNELEKDEKGAQELVGKLPGGFDFEKARKNGAQIQKAIEAQREEKSIKEDITKNAERAASTVSDNLGKMTPEQIAGAAGKGLGRDAQQSILKKLQEAKQKQDEELTRQIGNAAGFQFDKEGKVVGRISPKESAEIQKKRDSGILYNADPNEIKKTVVAWETTSAEAKRKQAISKVAKENRPLLEMGDDARRIINEGKNPQQIIKDAQRIRAEIDAGREAMQPKAPDAPKNKMGGDIVPPPNLEAAARDQRIREERRRIAMEGVAGGIAGGTIPIADARRIAEQRRNDPMGPFDNFVGPRIPEAYRKDRGIPDSQNFGPMFDKAGGIFSNFVANFGKQIEALSNIPNAIDMNVNQRVEIIFNGAEILANLEPSMRKMANGAIGKAMESLGNQLGDFNIKVNYTPENA